MPVVYAFRLRDPWQCEPDPEGVRWLRLFRTPPNLEPGESLQLAVVGLPPEARVAVNDVPLVRTAGENGAATFAIPAAPADRSNRIAVVLPATAADGSRLPFSVELQIVTTA
ncbi:MAG: hypothetical protein KF847_16860 [Pirellulales bacterium]|nr:hypothetical protein [Pirellulales bacterium]